jgi:hypothetical protein
MRLAHSHRLARSHTANRPIAKIDVRIANRVERKYGIDGGSTPCAARLVDDRISDRTRSRSGLGRQRMWHVTTRNTANKLLLLGEDKRSPAQMTVTLPSCCNNTGVGCLTDCVSGTLAN